MGCRDGVLQMGPSIMASIPLAGTCYFFRLCFSRGLHALWPQRSINFQHRCGQYGVTGTPPIVPWFAKAYERVATGTRKHPAHFCTIDHQAFEHGTLVNAAYFVGKSLSCVSLIVCLHGGGRGPTKACRAMHVNVVKKAFAERQRQL